jgi:hypothetical protein
LKRSDIFFLLHRKKLVLKKRSEECVEKNSNFITHSKYKHKGFSRSRGDRRRVSEKQYKKVVVNERCIGGSYDI